MIETQRKKVFREKLPEAFISMDAIDMFLFIKHRCGAGL